MRSTLSLMFMTLACIIAFTIAQPEILEASSDAGPISSVAGISRLQEAGISEPDSNEADNLLKQIYQNEENWATKSLLNLITMQMRERITRFLTTFQSTEDLCIAMINNPGSYRDQNNVIKKVMTIVEKMVEVKIKPHPDSKKEGIQEKEGSQQIAQLFEELNMLLTTWGVSTERISSLISLVNGYTSSGKIEPLSLNHNQIVSLRDASTHVSGRAIASQGVKVKVIRNGGHVWIITEAELVRDDIILVERGQIVPADCRVIWSMGLKVDELSLTGVSDHVEKSADDVSEVIPNDCHTYKNLIMKGTTVTEGEGLAIVFGTGLDTREGLYQKQQIVEKSKLCPMMKKIQCSCSKK